MQHYKIIGRARDSLQFRRDAMMISFIVILSFATKAISSLSVQGSLSTPNDDTVLIDLFANESNDSVDELVGKLHAIKQIRLTVDFGGKIIKIQQVMLTEINDEINRYQNYLIINFNKMISSINVTEREITRHATNHASFEKSDSVTENIEETVMRKVYCKILQNDDFVGRIISRTCSVNLISIDKKSKNSTDRSHNKTQLKYNVTTGDQIAPEIETRILHHSTLMTDIAANNSKKNSSASKINSISREHKINESVAVKSNLISDNSTFQMTRDKNSLVVKTVSKNLKTTFKKTNFKQETDANSVITKKLSDDFLMTKVDLENRFGLSKDVAGLPSSKPIRKTVSSEENSTNISLSESLQRNVTNNSVIFSHRAFQVRVPWSKDENVQNQSRVSKIKMDKISTIDEILEAVHRVLPTKELAKMPSKGSKMMSGVS